MHPFKIPSYKPESVLLATQGLTSIIRCFTGLFILEIVNNPEYGRLVIAMKEQKAASAEFHIRKTDDAQNVVTVSWAPEASLLTVKTQTDVKLRDEVASLDVIFGKKEVSAKPKTYTYDFSAAMRGFLYTVEDKPVEETVGVLRRIAQRKPGNAVKKQRPDAPESESTPEQPAGAIATS